MHCMMRQTLNGAMRTASHVEVRAARTPKHSVRSYPAGQLAGVALGRRTCRGVAALIYGIGAWAEATACSRASSDTAWSPGFLGPDPAVDAGGGFAGTA